jgi:hypothetical protein
MDTEICYQKVKFPLKENEIKKLKKVWKFIEGFYKFKNVSENLFTFGTALFSSYAYRELIIKKIRNTYKPEKFYKYEKIVNKLYWNLKTKLKIKTKCEKIDFFEKEKFESEKYRGSMINKIIMHNNKKNYYCIIDKYTYIQNLKNEKEIFTAMLSQNNYEKKMLNPDLKFDDDFIETYYPYDYPFPNISLGFYNKNNKSVWINRIKKYYYHEKSEKDLLLYPHDDFWWYNLIDEKN